MSRSTFAATVLFWTLMLLGGGGLAICLVLPPWLEYQGLLATRAAQRDYVAELETHLTATQTQIRHIQTDPAYVERLYQREFDLPTPGVEMVMVGSPDEGDAAAGAAVPARADEARDDPLFPALSRFLTHMLDRYPAAQLAMRDETRPYIMLCAAGLMLTALLLLSSPGE